ncbi:hypothetical protein ADUPG1_011958, partial [Aduncisulcus paluster]
MKDEEEEEEEEGEEEEMGHESCVFDFNFNTCSFPLSNAINSTIRNIITKNNQLLFLPIEPEKMYSYIKTHSLLESLLHTSFLFTSLCYSDVHASKKRIRVPFASLAVACEGVRICLTEWMNQYELVKKKSYSGYELAHHSSVSVFNIIRWINDDSIQKGDVDCCVEKSCFDISPFNLSSLLPFFSISTWMFESVYHLLNGESQLFHSPSSSCSDSLIRSVPTMDIIGITSSMLSFLTDRIIPLYWSPSILRSLIPAIGVAISVSLWRITEQREMDLEQGNFHEFWTKVSSSSSSATSKTSDSVFIQGLNPFLFGSVCVSLWLEICIHIHEMMQEEKKQLEQYQEEEEKSSFGAMKTIEGKPFGEVIIAKERNVMFLSSLLQKYISLPLIPVFWTNSSSLSHSSGEKVPPKQSSRGSRGRKAPITNQEYVSILELPISLFLSSSFVPKIASMGRSSLNPTSTPNLTPFSYVSSICGSIFRAIPHRLCIILSFYWKEIEEVQRKEEEEIAGRKKKMSKKEERQYKEKQNIYAL